MNTVMAIDAFVIFLVSLFSAVVGEGISYLLIYRTEKYKKLKVEIDKLSKKLERKKETTANISKQKSKEKKVDRYEGNLKTVNRDMSMAKMKSMGAVGVTLFLIFTSLGNVFDGKIVSKLPFEPYFFVRGMSHRNLAGTDFTDCSFVFLYVLGSMSIRSNLQKAFNLAPRSSIGSLFAFGANSGGRSK